MSIKTILVPADGSDESAEALATALVVARRFDAHIDVLHVKQRADEAVPFMFDRLSSKLKKAVLAEAERAAEERAVAVRAKFDEFCAANSVPVVSGVTPGGVSASWLEESGQVADVLVSRGRLADVICVARPQRREDRLRRSPAGANLEAVLLGAGRPVLIVPPAWRSRRVEHAAIGWNESLEASRALAVTIPWLHQMSAVSVIVSRKRQPRVGAVVDYLAWHGCSARVEILDEASSVGEAMLATCTRVGAEFLVVGGFSRDRSRQLLFGGVTRHLLGHSEIVTVMVH